MRWRTAGVNHEGRAWTLAPTIVLLARTVDAEWPERHPTDGTVAGKTHDKANPKSDHRPTPYTGPGIVRAIDIGGTAAPLVAEAVRLQRHPSVKYVIHSERIFASYATASRRPWEWGPYSGYNAHLTHTHVSTLTAADNFTTPWNIISTPPEEDPMEPIPLQRWSRPSYEWAIAAGIYTLSDELDDIREPMESQRQMVFLHRYHLITHTPQLDN